MLLALDSRVLWSRLAGVLDLPCPDAALPARVECPACRGRLSVYHDSTTGGYWHHCVGCRSSGDSIALAALCWGIPPADAVVRLARSGVGIPEEAAMPDAIANYLAAGPEPRDAATRFWADARRYLTLRQSTALGRLRVQLRIASTLSLDAWAEGPGQLVGAYPYREVRTALAPCRSVARRPATPWLHRALFKGRGWGDVLVFPYYSAPGRLCGFEFVGRGGAGPADRDFCLTADNTVGTEAGLAGLHTVEQIHPRFGTHIFAVADPALALRLQIRNAAATRVPLPLVAWSGRAGARTAAAWATIQRRRVVFWGWELTAELVHQAVQCDGLIALVEFTEVTPHAISHYFRLRPPGDLLRTALRSARPWRTALADWATRRQTGEVDTLMAALEDRRIDTAAIAAALGEAAYALYQAPTVRTAQVAAATYTETEAGWFVTKKRRSYPVSDAVLRIHRILTGPRPRYQGAIHYQGETVPFDLTAATMERDAPAAVRRLCLQAGLGRPDIQLRSAVELLAIATAFHTPETVRVVPDGP